MFFVWRRYTDCEFEKKLAFAFSGRFPSCLPRVKKTGELDFMWAGVFRLPFVRFYHAHTKEAKAKRRVSNRFDQPRVAARQCSKRPP